MCTGRCVYMRNISTRGHCLYGRAIIPIVYPFYNRTVTVGVSILKRNAVIETFITYRCKCIYYGRGQNFDLLHLCRVTTGGRCNGINHTVISTNHHAGCQRVKRIYAACKSYTRAHVSTCATLSYSLVYYHGATV